MAPENETKTVEQIQSVVVDGLTQCRCDSYLKWQDTIHIPKYEIARNDYYTKIDCQMLLHGSSCRYQACNKISQHATYESVSNNKSLLINMANRWWCLL